MNQYVSRQHWRDVTPAKGFPQQALAERGAIIQDSAGRIWFGCDGLSMFDGVNWHHFDKDDGLSEDSITSLHEDAEGNLWIGTINGIIKYDGNRWKTFRIASNYF